MSGEHVGLDDAAKDDWFATQQISSGTSIEICPAA